MTSCWRRRSANSSTTVAIRPLRSISASSVLRAATATPAAVRPGASAARPAPSPWAPVSVNRRSLAKVSSPAATRFASFRACYLIFINS